MRTAIRTFAGITGGVLAGVLGLSAALAQVTPLDTNHVVIIDRSGSMYGTNLALAQQAAKVYKNTLASSNVPASQSFTEQIGLASYSDTASTSYPITPIPASGYDAAVDALVASGSTSIGAGLEEALDMLTAANPTKGPRECVVLLSDGQHNTPPAPSDFFSDYFNRVDEVHSIALGAGADEAMMSDIATDFGASPGLYMRADTSTDIDQLELLGAFFRMANDCRNGGMMDQGLTEIPANMTLCASTLVTAAEIVDFTMLFVGGVAPVVYLKPPSQHPEDDISETSYAASISDMTFVSADNFKRFSLNVTDPLIEDGDWEFCAVNNSPSPLYLYSAVSTLMDNIQLNVTTNGLNVGAQPLTIAAEVTHLGNPVTGATVSAEMEAPSGAVTSLTFYDDGLAAHADIAANDGVYSTKFSQFAEGGSHQITVFADHAGNSTVPEFTRQHTFGVYKDPTTVVTCQSLGQAGPATTATVNGTACFQIDPANYPTGWTPANLWLQVTAMDGLPLNGVTVSANGGAAQSAAANSWSMQLSTPFPGAASPVVYQVSTTSSRQLQLAWHP
ncbi:VWA domain-containing protein [Sorangium cellulosum]|uniref:VWA domain-containing protein n=1 Tax=Sorangium cellulosum TaxID=56 RepID=UPI0007C44F1A|nr:VWA domain-containing protein [Sorangium cellulosum]